MLTKQLYVSSILIYLLYFLKFFCQKLSRHIKINIPISFLLDSSSNQFSSNLFPLFQRIESIYLSYRSFSPSTLNTQQDTSSDYSSLYTIVYIISFAVNNIDDVIQRLIIDCQYNSVGFKLVFLYFITSKCHILKCGWHSIKYEYKHMHKHIHNLQIFKFRQSLVGQNRPTVFHSWSEQNSVPTKNSCTRMLDFFFFLNHD